jgi:hypothetical protein
VLICQLVKTNPAPANLMHGLMIYHAYSGGKKTLGGRHDGRTKGQGVVLGGRV